MNDNMPMLSAAEYVQIAERMGFVDDLRRFPMAAFNSVSVAVVNREFLTQAGLPEWAAPHMHFGGYGGTFLPRLRDWPWRTEGDTFGDSADLLVIGDGPTDDPVCLAVESSDVLVVGRRGGRRALLNSSVPQMCHALAHYRKMVDEALRITGEESFVDLLVPKELIDQLQTDLSAVDSVAMTTRGFWRRELDRLRDGSVSRIYWGPETEWP